VGNGVYAHPHKSFVIHFVSVLKLHRWRWV